MKNRILQRSLMALLLLSGFFTASAGNWTNYSNYIRATGMAQRGNEIWVSDKSGLLMYNTSTGDKTFFEKTSTQLPSLTVERVRVNALTNDIWIGTYDNGLAMLHNSTWTHIPFPVADARLYEMKLAADGTVWCATTEGVYRYQNGVFTLFLANQAPWDIDLLPNGKLLCGGTGPFIFDPVTQTQQNIPCSVFAYSSSKVKAKDEHHFFFSSDHGELVSFTDSTETDTLHIGSAIDMQINDSGNLLLLDEHNVLHEKTGAYCNTLSFGNSTITAFLTLPNGELWGAGSQPQNTLFHLNAQSQANEIDVRQCGLNDNRVNHLNNTADGSVLLSSGHSLQKFNPYSKTFTTISLDSITNTNVYGVTELNGKIYAGTNYKYFYEYTEGQGWQQRGNGILPNSEVTAFDTDGQGNLWMCGHGYIAKFDGVNFTVYDTAYHARLGNYIRDIHCDRTRNQVWFCSYDGIFKLQNGVVSFYNDSTPGIQQYYDAIGTIEEDAAHNIWFGAVYGGLIKYDGNTFSSLVLPSTQGNQFISDIVFNENAMYVSDNLFGIWKYENGQWDSLNTGNSALTDNYVTCMNVDTRGNLWIGHLSHGADIYNAQGVSLNVENIQTMLNASIYPNPATGEVHLKWNDSGNADISVYAADGRQILQVKNAVSNTMLSLTNQSSGLYIAEVKTNTATQRIKLLLQ